MFNKFIFLYMKRVVSDSISQQEYEGGRIELNTSLIFELVFLLLLHSSCVRNFAYISILHFLHHFCMKIKFLIHFDISLGRTFIIWLWRCLQMELKIIIFLVLVVKMDRPNISNILRAQRQNEPFHKMFINLSIYKFYIISEI